MLIRIVVIACYFEVGYLRSSGNVHLRFFTFLLREYGCCGKSSKLKNCLHTKKSLATRDQRAVQREAYVSGFYFLNNFIFISGILQLHLIFKIESGFSIIVGGQFKFIPDFSNHVKLDLFVKVKGGDPSLLNRESRIFCSVNISPENEFCGTLWADIYRIPSENPIEENIIDFNRRYDVSFLSLLVQAFCMHALFPVIFKRFMHTIIHIFIVSHVGRFPILKIPYFLIHLKLV